LPAFPTPPTSLARSVRRLVKLRVNSSVGAFYAARSMEPPFHDRRLLFAPSRPTRLLASRHRGDNSHDRTVSVRRPMAAVSWRGGKDSCLAYLRAQSNFSFAYAITMMNEDGIRSRSHGLRSEVIHAQVEALDLQWIHRGCSWSSYEAAFVDALKEAFARGVTHLVCGDILYPEHKRWVERMCGEANLAAVEPIWGGRTVDLYEEFLKRGVVARIVSVDASKLSEDWLYRQLALPTMGELQHLGVDPCGENGEYHTLVTSCPAFSRTLAVDSGEHVLQSGYWAVDVHLASQATLSTSSGRKGALGS
jgi:uncharacterized protein (TIGR00290 family)